MNRVEVYIGTEKGGILSWAGKDKKRCVHGDFVNAL